MKYYIKTRSVIVPHTIVRSGGDSVESIKTRIESCDMILDNQDNVVMVIRDNALTNKIIGLLNK